jgi:hypothetical protein
MELTAKEIVAEIVAMIKTKQPGIVVSNGITSTE